MFVVVLMFVSVPVCVLQRVRRNGHHQAAVLHALQADQPVGKLLHPRRLAVDDQHLKAGVVVKVGMAGGNHQIVVLRAALQSVFR